jgi:hypothetical protein
MRNSIILICLGLTVGCSDDDIDSDEAARRAYLGLDKSIEKSIGLGFDGFNAASSANIDPQMAPGLGNPGGTLTVTGQVDQGASANKGMRLYVGMDGYTDGEFAINDDGDTIEVVYDTDVDPTKQPYLTMQLKGIPTGMLDGQLTSNSAMTGVYLLSGDLVGELTLNLTISGTLMAGPNNTVLRVPGSTTVTGTATNSDGGVYMISLTI